MNPKNITNGRCFLVILCAAGAWISAELLKAHAGPWPSSAESPALSSRLCADPASACGPVLKSNWSAVDVHLPAPTRSLAIRWVPIVVPVAFVGLAYFVFLATWLAFSGPPDSWGRWFIVPLLTGLSGAIGSVALLGILMVKVKSTCPWCLATHGINAVLLAGMLSLWFRAKRARPSTTTTQTIPALPPPDRRHLSLKEGVMVIALAATSILGMWMYHTAKLETRAQVAKLVPYKKYVEKLENDPKFLVREFFAQPRLPISDCPETNVAATSIGLPVVDIFTDFQCPHCACFANQWKNEYRPRWRGPLQVRLRHFPLNTECNDSVTGNVHADACMAGYAAEAARLQGGDEAFWRMHDLLFANSRRLNAAPYAQLAQRIGLDVDRLLNDMAGEQVRFTVASDIALAAEWNVHGTPAVFLNGRRVPQLCLNNPLFWEAISLEFAPTSDIVSKPPPPDHDRPKACCQEHLTTVQATP